MPTVPIIRSRLQALRERLPFVSRRDDNDGPPADAPPPKIRRVRTPTVLQMEAVECGAAALAMVLAYHGRWVPLEELRTACGVSRDGSKASNVLRAARAYGLDARGYKREPAQLRSLQVPMIVHWNFNHFLVLEGFSKGRAYLNDPSGGPTIVSDEEFDKSFTGVALVFNETEDFRRGGEQPSVIRALGRRLPGSRNAFAFIVLAGLALLIPGIVAPSFNKVFVDDILVKSLSEWVKPLMFAMGTAALLAAGLTGLQQRYLLRLETKLSIETSGKFFWHVLRLPAGFFTQRFAGDIGSRVGINDKVAKTVSGDLATTTINMLLIVFYAVLLLQYDVTLTIVGIATAALNIGALRWASRRRVDLNRRLQQDRGRMLGAAMGGLMTIETLKATGAESDFFSRWAGHHAKVTNAYQQAQLTATLLGVVPPMLMGLNAAITIGVGGLRVMDGRLSMGLLVAFQALLVAFLNPINKMVDLGGQLQDLKGDLSRLDDVLRAQLDPHASHLGVAEEEHDDATGTTAVKLSGHLELRNVTFGYSRLDPPLITNFNLTLRPGARVALVGSSGCGKSTIAKLVAGLYQPWEGEMLFDGVPRSAVSRRTLTSSLAVVDQDVSMFEGTISENITLWDETIPDAAVLQAARDGAIHEEVAARNGGYAGGMEEGGRNFSGGQRQRLEIARALANNPSILVLDEATSALDPSTEKMIDDNLRRRGCTCLIIAHRLSTIRDCEEIIVLDRGVVVQRGTHESLSAVPGRYQSLIASE
ncbi:MAG TPA: NHLP family bacteriocin export ABC transporter peptidase/permease/ATPase subunit [Gemmatimonadaceae bacterium]|nr:NHLP family bacteriocin export ABC transporter peptidase/permease/ATPase subunit [Gemmatimonadaceae bacterium]